MSRSIKTNRTACMLVLLATGSLALAGERRGFFYAVGDLQSNDRLWRIDFDGTLTPIGPEGGLGYPDVRGIVWDPIHEVLYGFDAQLDVWLRINTLMGVATEVGPYALTPFDMTYNRNDGLVYAMAGNSMHTIVPETGETAPFISDLVAVGVAHVLDTTGGFDGLFTSTSNGLTLFAEPGWQRFDFGGNVNGKEDLMWNPVTDELYRYWGSQVDKIDLVNQVTGDVSPLLDWDFSAAGVRFFSITFIPEPVPTLPPECQKSFDANGDHVIDLLDFQEWQNCFSGPTLATTEMSTFDSGDDGWFVGPQSDTFGEITGGGSPNYRSSGGNPGGYISWDDLGPGTHWFFGAPSKFRGDMSWAYGKKLTFDLRQFSDNPDSPTANPFVVLNGQSKSVFIRVFENPGSTWTSYSLSLDTTEGWRIGLFSSTEATEADIREVLSDLDLRIRGEYGIGADTGSLDNVVFGAD